MRMALIVFRFPEDHIPRVKYLDIRRKKSPADGRTYVAALAFLRTSTPFRSQISNLFGKESELQRLRSTLEGGDVDAASVRPLDSHSTMK